MLNLNQKSYGVNGSSNKFLNQLTVERGLPLLDEFDVRTLSILERDEHGDMLPKRGLTLDSMLLLEMWSGMMKNESPKQEISVRLHSALLGFHMNGSYLPGDSKPVFYLSEKSGMKGDDGIDTTRLNYHLLNTFQLFNKNIYLSEHRFMLQIPNLRNFFYKKALLAHNLDQAFYALNGLKITSDEAPFLQLASSREVDISQIDKASAAY